MKTENELESKIGDFMTVEVCSALGISGDEFKKTIEVFNSIPEARKMISRAMQL
jgi:hypothetical protein